MAAPVVPDPTFSALYDDASKWTHPTVDYEYYTERVGAPNPTTTNTMDRPTTITTLVNLANAYSDTCRLVLQAEHSLPP